MDFLSKLELSKFAFNDINIINLMHNNDRVSEISTLTDFSDNCIIQIILNDHDDNIINNDIIKLSDGTEIKIRVIVKI